MITIPSWLALGIVIAVPILIFAGKIWIRTFVESRVKIGFEEELEVIRSDLRNKEAEISSLRDGVLSGRTARLAIVEKRRIEAVENVWIAVTKLNKMKGAAQTISMFKMDKVGKLAQGEPKFREILKTLSGNEDLTEKLNQISAEKERPFVSPLAWALFSAYSSIIVSGQVQLSLLAAGMFDVDKVMKHEHTNNLIKTVLPHRIEYIDKYGFSGQFQLLEEIEGKILEELRVALSGAVEDQENIKRSAEIMKQACEVTADFQKAASGIAS